MCTKCSPNIFPRMVHFALVKTRLTEESPFHQFFRYILFLHRIVRARIENINHNIRYRLLNIPFYCLLYEFYAYLYFLGGVELNPGFRIIWYVCIITIYVLLLLQHQFIYRYRQRLMTTTLFQTTSNNYYKQPTLEELVTILYSLVNLENLPHIDVEYLIRHSIKHCYQPG